MTDKTAIKKPAAVNGDHCCEACERKLAGCFDVLKALLGLCKREQHKNHSEYKEKNDEGTKKARDPVLVEDKASSFNRELPEGKEFNIQQKSTENVTETTADFDLNSWLNMNRTEPLLYTEKDMVAREAKWKKQIQQLEALRNEEIAMRELVEQDAKEKQDSLRSEIEELRKAVVEYEKTIIQLSETTQEDTLMKQDRVSELIKEKEQLQAELNAADSSTYDAYRRMEKMKQSIDSLKQNEAALNACISDYQKKLKDSEERYQNLRKQAEARVEKANIEIEMVKKSKEVDLAGLQAALKQLQAKNASAEMALKQKTSENEELTKILEDLISRVTPDS